jgi:methyl-accepting chemotaxis protein
LAILKGIRNVRTKILAGFAVVAAVTLGLGLVSVLRMRALADDTTALYDDSIQSITTLREADTELANIRASALDQLVATTEADMTANDTALAKQESTVRELVAEYRSRHLSGHEDQLRRFDAAFDGYMGAVKTKAVPLLRAGDAAGFRGVDRGEMTPAFEETDKAIEDLLTSEDEEATATFAAATTGYQTGRTVVVVFVAGAVGLAVAVGLAIAGIISTPLRRSVAALDRVAAGDLTVHVEVDQQDEVGRLAAALNRMIDRMGGTVRSIGESATLLTSASEALSAVSQELSATAEEASAQAGSVSVASDVVSANVQTAASGAEEMGASIREIAGNATQAVEVAASAAAVAAETDSTVTKLGRSSTEIGEVVQVITSIAEQTNLLALNATIEAARAGDAGKGFAVVANEVKELAAETSKATGDIRLRIAAIQGDAGAVAGAIAQITAVIGEITDFQSTIASAVEEQTVTTSEIARNVSEAATGSSGIAGSISSVAEASQQTSAGASNILTAAGELGRQADELKRLVDQFQV